MSSSPSSCEIIVMRGVSYSGVIHNFGGAFSMYLVGSVIVILIHSILVRRLGVFDVEIGAVGSVSVYNAAGSANRGLAASLSPGELDICC